MCRQCGCNQTPSASTDTGSTDPVRQTLHLQAQVLAKNTQYADHNRALFSHLLAVNVLSSPGAGKTTLLQQLLKRDNLLSAVGIRPGVIVGDLATERDAERLHQAGIQARQITTGNLCHLEASSVAKAAHQLDLATLDFLVIENVGNLVCPAAYDLGEDLRIVVMSVTEGEDKPLKYPTTFKLAQVVVISKIDLAAAVEFDREETLRHLHQIAPQAVVFELSAKTGEGMRDLADYLRQAIADQHNKVKTDSVSITSRAASPMISQRL
ncbi:hydrogenase accessory protein HypB [Synechococcus sp. PCC 7335]|uniref:hydrogenase nickel incorporation protein HypB n=1 Tax=Synechococcus sp. (strain ATCC 29403 / PCC 7335) TaxID=91464 RepID=UPI00017EE0FE|nr:hydrogenase nickel incorporation protein HypB [Synechococcus sp. PCC 7335]EDX83116.1 hydrogenase accessory protein HypB [Synechococcus sp. PCC 7335]